MAKGNSPPSRKRYDDNNPVISIRLTLEQYQQLLRLLERLDLTVKRFFLGALEDHTPLLEGAYMTDEELEDYAQSAIKTGKEDGHREGFRDGYAKARKEYAVNVPCSECGQPAVIRGEALIAWAAQILSAYGLRHKAYPPPREDRR